jgi:hypothetical protein
MKKYFIIIIILLYSSCNKESNILDFNLLFKYSGLSFEKLDLFANKYSNHDKDYNKLKNMILFDNWPDLTVPESERVYKEIRTIEQGSRIADVLFHMRYRTPFSRSQIKYKNMYIYYYYNKNIENWLYIVILSEHTAEILYSFCSDNISPVL